jgi:hypothetical protein
VTSAARTDPIEFSRKPFPCSDFELFFRYRDFGLRPTHVYLSRRFVAGNALCQMRLGRAIDRLACTVPPASAKQVKCKHNANQTQIILTIDARKTQINRRGTRGEMYRNRQMSRTAIACPPPATGLNQIWFFCACLLNKPTLYYRESETANLAGTRG